MITIRLVNSSLTSVSNANMKKHMAGNSLDICEESNVVAGGGVSVSQEYGVGRWGVGGREVGGLGGWVGRGGVT